MSSRCPEISSFFSDGELMASKISCQKTTTGEALCYNCSMGCGDEGRRAARESDVGS